METGKGKENANRQKNMLDTVEINHVQHISFTQSRLTDDILLTRSGSIVFFESLDKFRLNEYNVLWFIVFVRCRMENYMTVKETAAKWKITERQVQILCKTNRIQGAIQVSRIWLIPSNALKPTRQ